MNLTELDKDTQAASRCSLVSSDQITQSMRKYTTSFMEWRGDLCFLSIPTLLISHQWAKILRPAAVVCTRGLVFLSLTLILKSGLS